MVTSRRLDAPLVGRERELGRLLRSFEDVVAERRCGLFTLLGPAGVGKSRLVHELVQRGPRERDHPPGPLPAVRRGDHRTGPSPRSCGPPP